MQSPLHPHPPKTPFPWQAVTDDACGFCHSDALALGKQVCAEHQKVLQYASPTIFHFSSLRVCLFKKKKKPPVIA
jgi:hypothetical protein